MSKKIILRHPSDVQRLINDGVIRHGNSRFIVIIALAGIFMDAFDFTSIAFGLTYVQEEFEFSALQLGFASGIILVGALIGSLSGGILMDRIGREKVFTADLVMLIVATLACALAPDPWTFIIARFLMGFAVGVDYPVALSFIAEYSDSRRKGSALNMYAPVWYVAVASTWLLLLIGYHIYGALGADISSLWRWVVGIGVVPAIIVLVLRRKYLTESASWLAQNGDLHRVAKVLRKAYGVDVEVAPDAVLTVEKTGVPARRAFNVLWTARYRMRTVLSLIVNFCQGLQYYAVGFSIGIVVEQVLGESVLTGILGPLVFNAIFGVAGGLVAVFAASRIGVRRLAIIGFCITMTSMVLVAILGRGLFPGAIVAACVCLGAFIFGHAAGPGTQGVVIATMSYPTSIRGTGVGFIQLGNRLGGTLGLVMWPVLTAALGLNALFVLAAAPLLGLLALLLIRWDPAKANVDDEDFEAREAAVRDHDKETI
ncbi:MFS transporter [Prauserella cavernicola]|uniref:MFS transporter n=1 Tax=Prauserella cavernicola TaxID=2800127 RepID=A0A934QLT9_9PSEU|nr:MFS transporter [Prauserella cavernicola]MBK1783562.1 MFS transporter [Prauserella cavernicola]